MPLMRRTIVSIVGPSSSGKSQLARHTATLLGGQVATRVPTDYYIVPRCEEQSLADFLEQPLRWDWALLEEALRLPDECELTTPDFDFMSFVRRSDSGGKPFTIRPVILIDAMGTYPGADLVVRIDVPDAERVARMRARDERWGSDVSARWDHLQVSWAVARETMPAVDIVLDGTLPLEHNARLLAEFIVQERLQRQG
jgi:uridine kinase